MEKIECPNCGETCVGSDIAIEFWKETHTCFSKFENMSIMESVDFDTEARVAGKDE